MAEKVLSISALAKEVYMQHVGGGTVPANMLPLVEQNAPKFPSSWAGNCCSSMTLALHFGILGALFKKISLVDDQRRPLEQFAVVEVFSGVQGKEHIWNVVRFAGDESWYSIDLSIEQYKEQQVSDPANKPWNLFPSSEGSYPYKEAGAVTDIATTHPLLPKVRCDASDAANFGVYWRVALEAVKTGFELKETDEDGQEVIVPVSADLVQAVTSKVSAVLRRLPDLKFLYTPNCCGKTTSCTALYHTFNAGPPLHLAHEIGGAAVQETEQRLRSDTVIVTRTGRCNSMNLLNAGNPLHLICNGFGDHTRTPLSRPPSVELHLLSKSSQTTAMAKLDGTCWEGRTWVACDPALDCGPAKKSFRLLSYNVLSDYKTSFLHYTTTKNWDIRSRCLLDEINTYNADIICLQDADHYQDWWRPQLTVLGYDTIYKQRTQTKNFHYEGVMIAFRRDVFQLFKSQPFELNNAVMNEDRGRAFKERSKTDDVGVIVFLQPWSKDCVNSAVCVCCTMLSDEVGNADIRMVQTNYVARQIELANMEFHVPVILACSMFDIPSSLAYTVMCTGRIPLAGQVPKRCLPPIGNATCRGSVLLKWLPPASSLADYPILCYRISWRPGGSQVLAFRAQIEVSVGDCVKYAERMDENRNIRMVALEERQFTISGLVSDVPYEFRVVAVNEVGEGVWSDVSRPVVMDNPERAPDMPELRQFANVTQLNENIELSKMQLDDRDAYVTKRIDAMSAQTQLTPRNLDGDVNPQVARSRVLPYELNPRTGWKEALKGTPDGRIAEALNKESIISKSVLRDHSGFKKKELNHYVDLDPPEESYSTQYDRNHSSEHSSGGSPTKLSLPKLALETARIRDRNAVLLDGKEVLDAIGVPNKRQAHDLMLSSAYTSYGAGGEPLFTATMPSEKNKIGTECMDYVFYSNGTLHVDRVLSIPLLSELRRGERAQASCAKEDVPYIKPYHLAEGSFDAHIQKLNQQLGIPNPPHLLGPATSEGIGAQVPRDTIVDAKRLLRSALEKSRVAGNQPLPAGTYEKHAKIDTTQAARSSALSTKKQQFDIDADGAEEDKDNTAEEDELNGENSRPPAVPELPIKTTPSGLWGGKWAGIPTYNHQRTNFWLPSETFASSHIALGVEFSINDQLLCTHWS